MSTNSVASEEDALRIIAEKLRVTAYAPNIHQYKPHHKQHLFHQSKRPRKLYIGGNRSGKTVGGVIEDLWWATKTHPYRPDVNAIAEPIRGRVIGVDFTNGVEKILFDQYKQWCPPSYLKGGSWETAYDKQLRTLSFANNSFIEFMSYDQDLDKFAGTSRHFVHFDDEPPNSIYTENVARLIDTEGSLWITMTPVEGMTWVHDVLYEPGLLNDNPEIEVIEVDMTENPYLKEQAVQKFLQSLTEEDRQARIHGKFVQSGGLIYKQFDPKPNGLHVIKEVDDEPYIPPSNWFWICSLDHGFNNPTAALWHAVNPEGEIITFWEHYQSGWIVKQHAAEIKRIERDRFGGRTADLYIADPSIRNTDPVTGTSIHQEYVSKGIAFMLANNDVVAGLGRVRAYIRPRDNAPPMWRVTERCPNLIKEMTRYRYKTRGSKKLEAVSNNFELPHKKDDHAVDSLRYAIMSRPDLREDAMALENEMKVGNKRFNPGTYGFDGITALDPSGVRYDNDKSIDIPDFSVSGVGDGTQWEFDEHLGGYW